MLQVTGVSGWGPRHVWEWWDSWGFWWAESGGEGVGLGVLGEDGNVGIPGGLGGVVAGQLTCVEGTECCSGGMRHLSDLCWHVSDDSDIVILGNGSEGGSVCFSIAGGGGWGGGRVLRAWEVGNVTVVLTRDRSKSDLCSNRTVLIWSVPVI